MQYILKSEEMKTYDEDSIKRIGIPSMVLMERAALAVTEELIKRMGNGSKRVLVAAGMGNNGGDGLAVGRLLALKGNQVTFYLAGNQEKMTAETIDQLKILKNLGFSTQSKLEDKEYDMVIDALFGIGLSRKIEGDYTRVIEKINQYGLNGAYICGVDIPSGICTDTGKVMGCAVRADLTVTFGFAKRGHLLYPGKEYCGELEVKDIGITSHSFAVKSPTAFCYGREELADLLPHRNPGGNKGTFGKVLLLAGSMDMSGACILCGTSILRAGAGMVKIITPSCNRQIIQQSIPEAMLYSYRGKPDEEKVKQALGWCDVVVAGPGMGMDENAELLMKWILKEQKLPMVIDADGLNLIAAHKELEELAVLRTPERTILTPHPGELNRLLKTGMEEYERNRDQMIFALAKRFHGIIAAKDAVTLVASAEKEELYINTSGNDALATAGSGDVLAGLMGGLLAQGMGGFEAACLSVYLHGLGGEQAGALKGRYGVVATDIINGFVQVMRRQEVKKL